MSLRATSLLCTALLWGCGSSTTIIDQNYDAGPLQDGGAGGGAGGGAAGGGAGGGDNDAGIDDCSDEAKLIYVVDQNKNVSSFNPRAVGAGSSPFTELGKLTCLAERLAEPFSMAVDRDARGWVVYDSGELFTVDLKSPQLTCLKTTFVPQQGIGRFGMGFVSDTPGGKSETLFISGSPLTGPLSNTELATLSTTSPHSVQKIGSLTGAPELTGTGDARLWAFFPDVSPPRVSQLDKASGQAIKTHTAASLSGTPQAWAFAFWGGSFYIFLERLADLSTTVYKMDAATGALQPILPDTGKTIVGAGVSTCAPVTIN